MPARSHSSSAAQSRARGATRRAAIRAIVFVALGVAAPAFAKQVILDAIHTGLYSSRGEFDSLTYVTGITSKTGSETRGFLIFDLTPLARAGRVTAAVLRVQNREWVNEEASPLELRVYGLPHTEANNFGRNEGRDGSARHFAFIGSQSTPVFAEPYFLRGDVPVERSTFVELRINVAGVADLNGNRADAYYAYGLKIIKADRQEPKPRQFVFGGSWTQRLGDNRVQLVLEVGDQAR